MCWGAKTSVLLNDYVYLEGGFIEVFCVSRIGVKETWSKFDKAAHRSLQGKSLLNMCRGELSAVIKKLSETYL